MTILLSRAGLACLSAFAVLTPLGRVLAQTVDPPCDAIPGATGPVIYGVGGSAQTPLIGQIASRLVAAADPLTIVYQDSGACKAMDAFNPAQPAANRYLTGKAKYWAAGVPAAKTCDLPANTSADFGSMQQYANFCPNVNALYDGLGDFKGPVGSVNLIVPIASSQNSISRDAVHLIFGFGAESGVDPWTEDAYIVRRSASSAVQLYIAKAADLPDAFNPNVGVDAETNGNSVNWTAAGGVRPEAKTGGTPAMKPAVSVANNEATIGFVSGEQADANREKVRTLAYQHTGQECAYWPDSTPTSYDKINVRRGQYFLWGDVHLYAPIDQDERIVDEDVRKLIGYVTGEVEAPAELPILDVIIENGNIPRCAMQVQRDSDLGALSSFQPDEPCGCYFEERANGSTSCESCDDDDDCPDSDPVCRRGFCEVK